MVWGTFLEKNFPSSNGHLLDFWGVLTLAGMVWGTYSEKMVKKNGKNGKMVKSRLKKVPQSARLSAGGGVIAIWALPTWRWGQVERCFP